MFFRMFYPFLQFILAKIVMINLTLYSGLVKV